MKLSDPVPFLMHRKHDLWKEFINRMADALKFECDGQSVKTDCNMSSERPVARKILANMGADVEASLAHFETLGGFCDCEIIMNVDQP